MRQILIGFCLLMMSLVARADLVVEVTQGKAEASPIAIVPFGWNGSRALPEDIAQIVSDDLQRSGFFNPLARKAMLSFPTSEAGVFYRDWRMTGADYLVIGRLEPGAGDQLAVTFELYDVLKGSRMLSHRLDTDYGHLRDAAHYIADQLFEALTGIKGAFSTRILYVTSQQLGNQKHRYRLQLADWDGARPRTILESNEPIMSPSWSKDGRKIVYVSFESGRPAIYVQYLNTGKRERIQSFPGLNGAPAWSPDGNRLALVLSKDGNPEIYVLNLQSRELQRVTQHYAIDTEPTWSPDGRALYFTSDRGGQPQIYKLDLASRDLQRVTFEGNYNSRGRLTQDGRFLAMVHREQGSGFSIAVQDLKTGRLDVLTDEGLEESPSIAPNGSVIIYATQQGNRGVLAAVSLDGQVRFRMPNLQGDVREPSWSPFLQ